MDERINRFLNSINLDSSKFDLTFKSIKKSNDIWLFDFSKKTLWKYNDLSLFLNAISSLSYKYKMTFEYEENINEEYLSNLFKDYFVSKNRVNFEGKMNLDENNIFHVEFINEETYIKNELDLTNFESMLDFVNYKIYLDFSFKENFVKKEIEIKNDDFLVDNDASQESFEDDKSLEEFENNYLESFKISLQNKLRKENQYLIRAIKNANFELCQDISKLKDKDAVEIIGEIYDGKAYTNKFDKMTFIGGIGNYTGGIRIRAKESKDVNRADLEKLDDKINSKAGKTILRASIKGIVLKDEKGPDLIFHVTHLSLLPHKEYRKDNYPLKRVELHLHTNLSQLDGIGKPEEYVALAASMGHKAIAVTDHGVVQAHPYMQSAVKNNNIKILYGVELYVVDRKQNYIFNPSKVRLENATYVCLDFETTGLSARYDRIIEFGAVKIKNNLTLDSIDMLINPGIKLEKGTTLLTHITDDMLKDKPDFKASWPKMKEFIGDSIIVTHNTAFDISMLNGELERLGIESIKNPVIDTLSLSRFKFSEYKSHNLGALSRRLGLSVYDDDSAHRADFDAKVLGDVWCELKNQLLLNNHELLHEDLGKLDISDLIYRNLKPFHVTCYAKNKQGLYDLYNLISLSHLHYFSDVPRVPRDELIKIRSNLIIGSGCLNGEVFEAAHLKTKKVFSKLLDFYDFIEVQPLTCYSPLVYKTRTMKPRVDENNNKIHEAISMPELKSFEEVKRTILNIIEVADEKGKMVCATGNVHYVDPEDKILREIYIAADGLGKRPHPYCTNPRGSITNHVYHECGDQHFRSTEEMMNEFSFLPIEKATEIVITNPNKIADMCEVIYPVKDKLYTPTIPNADEDLRKLAYDKAKELYGDPIPEFLVARLEREFSRIITSKQSYAVNYLLAQKLIKRSNDDGYFVGSRGSVGSSFVAFLLGITEVNPLPQHYYCKKCHKITFVNDPNYLSGVDLPKKNCETCGTPLICDGQNIPFETFLGFDDKSSKVPDIDLNFANEYQAKAHQYLRDLFGKDHVFRAGTISAYQDKQTYGCVRDYFIRSLHVKNFDKDVSKPYASFLAAKAAGVKKTTGQHPGGIILIPTEFKVYDFTPIQYPADDDDSGWETTHFEFSKIHDTVLKLDLLGHKDPLALKKMCELTKFDFMNIPLGDEKVLSLFTSPNALNLRENFLGLETGTLGLPEFGTEFVQGVLKETNPKKFNDLLIISGLTHGTNVWAGNQQDILKNGTVKSLSDIIGCRDDIMTYLISKGVPDFIAFNIMEDVRKSKKIKEEYMPILLEKKIPEYYIKCCNKIKYLFPRAHAAAYVTQAVRVGYYKVYFPLEFYAVFFSTRCDEFDIDSMIKGEEACKQKYIYLKEKSKVEKLTPKEEDIISTLEMCIEMFERGFKFSNIDINKSLCKDFIIDKENKSLIPPFIVIDGLGEAVGDDIVKARNERGFSSIQDFSDRCKASKTHIAKLKDLGCFNGYKEDDEITLFDFNFD